MGKVWSTWTADPHWEPYQFSDVFLQVRSQEMRFPQIIFVYPVVGAGEDRFFMALLVKVPHDLLCYLAGSCQGLGRSCPF